MYNMSFNAKFSQDSLTSLNFWQLAELLANADNVKKYLSQVKDAMAQLDQVKADADASMKQASELMTLATSKDASLTSLLFKANEDYQNYLALKAAKEVELKDKQEWVEATTKTLANQANELDARTRSLEQSQKQWTKQRDEELDMVRKQWDDLKTAQEKLLDDQLVFETKQKALKEALKSV